MLLGEYLGGETLFVALMQVRWFAGFQSAFARDFSALVGWIGEGKKWNADE